MFDPNPIYTYSYQVADENEQTFIAHEENRDGEDVTGEYSYVDPLGDLVTVTYRAGVMGYTEERSVQPGFVTIRARPVSKPALTASSSTFFGSSGASGFAGATGSFSGNSAKPGFITIRAPESAAGFTSGNSNQGTFSSFSANSNRAPSRFTGATRNQQTTTTTTSSPSGNEGLVGQVIASVAPQVQQVVSTTSTSSANDGDLVARILAQLTPLIRQTVSNSLSGRSVSN